MATGSHLDAVALTTLGQRLAALRLCDPSADEQVRRSLDDHGQLSPVVAFADREQRLELVDGFKRWRAARALEWPSLQVRVLPVAEVVATGVIDVLHQQQRLTELRAGLADPLAVP